MSDRNGNGGTFESISRHLPNKMYRAKSNIVIRLGKLLAASICIMPIFSKIWLALSSVQNGGGLSVSIERQEWEWRNFESRPISRHLPNKM